MVNYQMSFKKERKRLLTDYDLEDILYNKLFLNFLIPLLLNEFSYCVRRDGFLVRTDVTESLLFCFVSEHSNNLSRQRSLEICS
jgi:hypothetical protein